LARPQKSEGTCRATIAAMFGFFQEIFDTIVVGMIALLSTFNIISQVPIPVPPTGAPSAKTEKLSPIEKTKSPVSETEELRRNRSDILIKDESEKTKTEIQTVRPVVNPVDVIPPRVDWDKINQLARTATVNIFCTIKNAGAWKPVSGTGILVTRDGLILTAAHLAQYLLIKDYKEQNFVDCSIRTGTPARPRYRAEIVYLSERWLLANAENIRRDEPTGSGESDFAILRVSAMADGNPSVPLTFDFLSPDTADSPVEKSETVLVAGFPSAMIGGIETALSLSGTSAFSTIQGVYQFSDNHVDLLSLGGSIVAQQGVSGGAVVNDKGALVGMTVVSTVAETTDRRDLRAISMAHVSRELEAQTGKSLLTITIPGRKESSELFSWFDTNIKNKLMRRLVEVIER